MGDRTQAEMEKALDLIQTTRRMLRYAGAYPAVSGYAAEEEIEEALNHIDAAIVDVKRHGEPEESDA